MRIISSLRALPTGPVVAVLILGIVFGERLQPVGVLSWLILTILVFYKAAVWMLNKRRTATSPDDDESLFLSRDQTPTYNPATGLPVYGGVDAAGNPCGDGKHEGWDWD
jgi:hypothetical protein